MATREAITTTLNKRFVSMLCGQEKLRLHPYLMEDYYLIYRMEDGVLCCYELRDGVRTGGRIDELTDGKFWVFAKEFLYLVEKCAKRNGHYAEARDVAKMRDELYVSLFRK